MRTSKRIANVALAGTLLLTLGLGPLALADQAATNPGATTTGTQAEASAQAALSLKTIVADGFQFQADGGVTWDVTGEDDTTSYLYLADDALASVEIYRGNTSYISEILADDPASYFTEGEDAQIVSEHSYTLDSMQAYSLRYNSTEEGMQATVLVTAMSSSSGAAVAAVMWTDVTDADTAWMLEQIARTLAPAAGAATAADEDLEILDGGVTTMNGAAETPTVGDAAVLELPKWTLEVSRDPDTFVYTTVESWDDAVDGKAVIGVPVTLTNTGTESSTPWWDLTIGLYGPSGVQQGGGNVSAAGWYFDDSLESLNNLRAGASTTAYAYFYDEGNGEYVAEFSMWDENYNTVSGEALLDVAR